MTHDEPTRERSDGAGDAGIEDGDVSSLESELRRRREPYARATVVRREPPASANVGDRALVTGDGEVHGWVGGAACAQSIVSTAGVDAIEGGEPKLVGIAPDPDEVDRPGLEAYPMTCHSDGVLELFVEPVLPTTELVIVGDSPVARSLSRMAAELALDVTVVADPAAEIDPDGTLVTDLDPEAIAGAVGPAPIVVVASMGKYDARGVAAGALLEAPYVGLVASDDRAAEEIERAAGLIDHDPGAVAAAVTNPAGVDIEAYTPAEIAVSLLAEVVDVRARRPPTDGTAAGTEDGHGTESDPEPGATAGGDDGEAVDPVCGMTVEVGDAAATVEHDGARYHFCCRGCADSFENEPESYLESGSGSGTGVRP